MNYNIFFLGSDLNLLLLQIENQCNFFDSFGILVQLILGLITLGILICKIFSKNTTKDYNKNNFFKIR